MTSPFIPISGSSPSHHGGYRKKSFSGASPGSAGGDGSRPRGSGSSSSFGGRARDVLRETKEVLSRLKWDLAETVGVDFATNTQVYVSAIRTGGGDETDIAQHSWCRTWVREGRCERKHCRCTHTMTLAPLGAKPSLKSSGLMAPLQVLEGDELEAAMGTVGSCGSGSGAGSQGGSFPSSSYYSSSPSGVPALYRAQFVVFGGRIVWDKERSEVWEGFVSSFSSGNGNGTESSSSSSTVRPPGAAPVLLHRDTSIDSLLDVGVNLPSGTTNGREGNGLLNELPADVNWELLTQYLEPVDCARSLVTCRGWAERAGDESLWQHFLRQKFGLLLPSQEKRIATGSPPTRRRTTDSLCYDLSTLALQDDDELLAESVLHPPTVRTPSPMLPAPFSPQDSILHTPFYHPRREYARLSHVCRNAQALSDWSGAAVGAGKQGHSASGSNGGGGGIFSSSPSVMYSSSPQVSSSSTSSVDLEQQQLPNPSPSSLPPIAGLQQPPPPRQHVVQRFHGHDRGTVIALHVDETKDRLISADVAGCIRLWELHSGARLGMVDLRMHVTCLTADAHAIYVGTVKGTLHTINRDDMTDVQAHKLLLGPQQASSISSLCLLQETPRPSARRTRGLSTPSSVLYGSSTRSEVSSSHLLRTPSPLFFQSGNSSLSANKAEGTRSALPLPMRRTPSPEGKSGPLEGEVRARLVIGFGNGSFMLLYGTPRLMHVHAPSSSFLPPAPAVLHHLYSLPISHPACVFLTATGPRSFAAAACPDRLFLWSAEDDEDGREEEEQDHGCGNGMGCTHNTEIAVLPLTSAFSKGVRSRLAVGQEEEEEEEEQLSLQADDDDDDDDVTGLGFSNRHRLDECCDVAILALLPLCSEEAAAAAKEEEEEEEGSLKTTRRTTLLVTACNHDVSLRWWELNPGGGKKRRHSRATCKAITPAFVLPSDGKPEGVGTLSLAQAGGVLLSAHLDGSLVVWHVGQRRPVAHYKGLPVLESLRLTPRGMDMLTCFERHVVYARETALLPLPSFGNYNGGTTPAGGSSVASEEDMASSSTSGSGRRRDRDKQGNNGGRPRRKNSFA